ncbi:MAG: HAD hydrolase family protein [Clostridium sp.]|nr:HAD hydrolase family protein [Clostridium sp.]
MTNLDLKYKASKIKAAVFDVDGVMTDGSLTFDENGAEYKTFNAKDGQGIVMLNKTGFVTAIITARDNGTVRHRFKNLCMTKLFEGCKNKIAALKELMAEYNLKYEEIAYMGDDLPDICVLKKVGLPCAPADAVEEVLTCAEFICSKNGGRGAVREMCDFILKSTGKYEEITSAIINRE